MHNLATGSQKAKDFDALRKSSKPHDTHSSMQCPALPPHPNCDYHSSYHTNSKNHLAKHSCSCSCSNSCSHSCDCRDDDHCIQRSSSPCHDTYIGHHDVCPSNKPYLYVSDGWPVGSASIASHISLHSSNVNFDSDLNNIKEVVKFVSYPNYNDNNSHSYIGEKPSKPDNIFCMGTFDIHNYTDPETKQYSYWYHTKLDAQPPAGLVDLHVTCYYYQEISFLNNEEKKQKLFTQGTKHCKFLHGVYQT